MIVLSLLLAAAAPTPAGIEHPIRHLGHRRVSRRVAHRKLLDARLHIAGCGYNATGRCATTPSPYRLPLADPLPPTSKADALAQTGARCAVIGQTICTHPPRTILHLQQ
jgi:hypothetical protein